MMKGCFLVSLFVLSFTFDISIAQNFFPLKVGNKYQIKNDWSWNGPGGTGGSGTRFKEISVVSDSVIYGEIFYAMSADGNGGPFLPGYLFRYDSLNQKLLVKIPGDDSIKLAADFNIPEDSVYTSYFRDEPYDFISGGISPEIFWGDTLQEYKMEPTWNTSSIYNYYFAESIGLTYFRYSVVELPAYGSTSKYYTISAIIDSTIFNPLILHIDSLYPVIDRPLNTFPYLLSIPLHATYYQLINHFQLAMEIERDSELVSNTNYNISVSNPHIQINPPNLQPGDIIRMKVSLTDTSIFNNSDVYPDSGWATFRVLEPVSVLENSPLSLRYKLEQNYPNPFNPVTIIKYEIPEKTYVSIKVYDILGNEVADLVHNEMVAGKL